VEARRGEKLTELEEITIPVLANIDQDFADYTEQFLRRMANQEKPFYLIHSFSKVHYDNYPAEGYAGKSRSGFPYKDAVVEVDDIVGRIVDVLKDTGLAENTLVLFTSDNGPEEDNFPDCGHTPFRGAKGTTWEGGVRVPTIAWWPGMIKGGRESDGLFDLADLFTTSLCLADAEESIPEDRYIDGIDQTSFLLSDTGQSNRNSLFYCYQDKLTALRWRHHKFASYVFVSPDGITESKKNTVLQKTSYVWAYDLTIDPKERFPAITNHTPRYTWVTPIMGWETMRYRNVLKRYPPKESQVISADQD